MYRITFSKIVLKDIENLKSQKLNIKAQELCFMLQADPYIGKKLIGDMLGFYSLRINLKHRLIYKIDNDNSIHIISMWGHYT